MSLVHELPFPDPLPPADTPEGRILRATWKHLLEFGYSSFTMDDLAHELGMSKKTLYVHFPSKEALVDRIIDRVARALTRRLDEVTSTPGTHFVQKLSGVVDAAGSMLSRLSPRVLRDLQRFTPRTYEKIERLRSQNIPLFFGRIIRAGIAEGKVRRDLDPDFAAQFWLQAIRGLVQPEVLERTQLTGQQTLQRAIDLFFNGVLSPKGRVDYEKYAHLRKTSAAHA